MGIWKDFLEDSSYKEQLSTRGYTDDVKFTQYIKRYSLERFLRRNGATTASQLSIDFFRGQSEELINKNCFLLRTGQGGFSVINMDFFDKSYLNLEVDRYKEIHYEVPKQFRHLIDAYSERLTENPSIELMHALGVFSNILGETCGETEYCIGPRGNRTATFEVYLLNHQLETFKIYTYKKGQEELDYSLFTKNAIFVFEAKSRRNGGGLDIGWHKLAYPLMRFQKYAIPKYPCYFLNRGSEVFIFIFPAFKYHNSGLILNDKEAMTPKRIFRVDLKKILAT